MEKIKNKIKKNYFASSGSLKAVTGCFLKFEISAKQLWLKTKWTSRVLGLES